MATTTAPNQNAIGLKRKNNPAACAACVESVCVPYSAKQQREIAKLKVLTTTESESGGWANTCESAQQYIFFSIYLKNPDC